MSVQVEMILDDGKVDTEIVGGEGTSEQQFEHNNNLPEFIDPVISVVEPYNVPDNSQVRRSERQRKNPERFIYPELGRTVKEKMVASHCCGVVGHGTKSLCFCEHGQTQHVWWCNSSCVICA